MSEFTVTEVHGSKDWGDGGQYGPKTDYEISLSGDQGRTEDGQTVQLTQKRETKPPFEGQVLHGELVQERGRWKFKKDRPQSNGFQGGGYSGGKTPDQQKSIVRQHSQDMAIQLLTLLHARGKIPEDAGNEFLTKYIDWFQRDAEGTGS